MVATTTTAITQPSLFTAHPHIPELGHKNTHLFNSNAQPSLSTSNPTNNTFPEHIQPPDFGAEYAEPQHHYTDNTHTPTETSIRQWTTLHNLATHTHTKQRFDTSKTLRSGAATDWDVYALWRLAQNIEQPERCRCLSKVKNILQFRNCTIPKQNKPLTIPFPAHPTFQKQTQAWLRRHIISQKNMAIPLHLATHRLREQAHLTINSILHNFMKWDTVKMDDLPPCSCSQFLQ